MINQQPILISGPPRCGTTMLAGLIAKHGVWVGNARVTTHPGTNSNFAAENQDIKGIMKLEAEKVGYKNWTKFLPDGENIETGLKLEIEKLIPDEIPWLVKTSWTAAFYRFWDRVYPEAKWVLPYRSHSSILDSMNRHPSMAKRPDAMKSNFIRALQVRQDQISRTVKNWIVIDVRKIANKETEEVIKLFDFLDITIDWDVVDSWLQPELMKR